MAADAKNALDREEQLDEIVAAYLDAVESGQAPDRRALLAQYPELADELAAFFADQDQFDSLMAPLRAATPKSGVRTPGQATPPLAADTPPPRHTPEPGSLLDGENRFFGDYELLEEMAVGGMGVVYKARQVSLGRIVALKMIRSGQLAAAEDVQRFRLETEAVANLDHPHVVPIYDVGNVGGRHYFTMRLIEGGNLTQRLEDYRLPAAEPGSRRSVTKPPIPWSQLVARHEKIARLLATIARAVDYAHQRGILHRDLKPANILIDTQGEPHITDFGLAKRVARPSSDHACEPQPEIRPEAQSSDLTQSGIAVGTPSYMAPEQAAGTKKALTTAADVYSLGAILYEMITGRPPFKGANHLETLLAVLDQEPAPPRSLSPWVNRDLETICLRCLEKDPTKRYGCAAALADDLERFLNGEPIEARPVGRFERVRRWVGRHPAQAMAALGAAGIFVVAVFFAFREASHARELRAEQEITRKREVEARALAVKEIAARKEAVANLNEANRNYRRARQFLDDFCFRLSNSKLNSIPGLQPVRKEILESGLKYYQKFLDEKGNDPHLKTEVALTLFSIANITRSIGSKEKALAAYEQSCKLCRDVLKKDPKHLWARVDLGRTCINMGTLQESLGKAQEALATQEEARAIFAKLTQEDERSLEFKSNLAAAYTNLGGLYRANGRLPKALDCFRRSLALQEKLVEKAPKQESYQREFAVGLVNMGVMHGVLGQDGEAVRCYERAHAIQDRLGGEKQNANNIDVQHDLALNCRRLGDRYCRTGQLERAKPLLDQGHAIMQRLVKGNPTMTDLQSSLAVSHRYLGHYYQVSREPDRALQEYQEACNITERLAKTYPTAWPMQRELANSYYHLGGMQRDVGQKLVAARTLGKARRLQEIIVTANPDNYHDLSALSSTLYFQAKALAEAARPDPARSALYQAIDQLGRAAARVPEVVSYQRDLANCWAVLGEQLAKVARGRDGLVALERAHAVALNLADKDPRSELFQKDLANSFTRLGLAHQAANRAEQACACYQQARIIRDRLLGLHPGTAEYLSSLAGVYNHLANVHFVLRRRDEEERYYRKAAALREEVVKAHPNDAAARHELCVVLNNLAVTLGQVGRPAEGVPVMEKSIALARPLVSQAPKNADYRRLLGTHYAALAWMLRTLQRPQEAAEASCKYLELWADNPRELVVGARDLARAVKLIGEGKMPPTSEEVQAREKYGAVAVRALQKAAVLGYPDRAQMTKSPELAVLRDRPDFKAFLTMPNP